MAPGTSKVILIGRREHVLEVSVSSKDLCRRREGKSLSKRSERGGRQLITGGFRGTGGPCACLSCTMASFIAHL